MLTICLRHQASTQQGQSVNIPRVPKQVGAVVCKAGPDVTSDNDDTNS